MKDSVAKFFEVVRQDEKLTERLRALSDKIDEFSRLSSELGRERGFEFEPADVQDAISALSQNRAGLTEEQLRAIAGGIVTPTGYGITTTMVSATPCTAVEQCRPIRAK